MKNVIIVFTFFSLWLSTQLNPVFQDYLAYALILTFGVLHGANDITLITSLSVEKKDKKPLLIRYLGAIGIVSILFFISKGVALLFFIVISAYHFGEQHFGSRIQQRSRFKLLFYLSYGFVVLFMIFSIRMNNVIIILKDISGWDFSESLLIGTLVVSSLVLLLLSLRLIQERVLKVNPLKELFYLAVLALVFSSSSLIWGFAIYFVFWHSLPSLKDQMDFLYGEASKRSFMRYLKTSFLYWLISVGGLFLLYWLLKDSVDYFITIVLYVLAAITFPHVMVMSKVENLKSST